jgi:hypothetical protein
VPKPKGVRADCGGDDEDADKEKCVRPPSKELARRSG